MYKKKLNFVILPSRVKYLFKVNFKKHYWKCSKEQFKLSNDQNYVTSVSSLWNLSRLRTTILAFWCWFWRFCLVDRNWPGFRNVLDPCFLQTCKFSKNVDVYHTYKYSETKEITRIYKNPLKTTIVGLSIILLYSFAKGYLRYKSIFWHKVTHDVWLMNFFIWRKSNVSFSRYLYFCVCMKFTNVEICDVIIGIAT